MSTSERNDIRYQAHPAMFRSNPFGFILCLLLAPLLIGILILAYWYIATRTKTLTITDQELRWEEGILSKSRTELKLTGIRSVRVYQSLFQRMFGTGDIQVFTAGDDPEIVVHGLPEPHRVRELTG